MKAVQQARALILRVAQRAHEGVAACPIQGARPLQRREDSSGHLQGQRRRAAGRPCLGGRSHRARARICSPPSPVRVPLTCPARTLRGVQRSRSGGAARARGWGLARRGGEDGQDARREARPCASSHVSKAALEGQSMHPTQRPAFLFIPHPTSPYSHLRNSPAGVLWVTLRRHPFRPPVLRSTFPRPAAAASPRGPAPNELRAPPPL